MQLQKFLLTSALYLSLASPAAVLADERESRDMAGEQAMSDTRTDTVGSDRQRFTAKEGGTLERRLAARDQERERARPGDQEGRRQG